MTLRKPVWRSLAVLLCLALWPSQPLAEADAGDEAGGEISGAEAERGDLEVRLKAAIAARERALGPEHPRLGIHLIELARHYRAKGRYAAAEAPLRRALAIWETALGGPSTWASA